MLSRDRSRRNIEPMTYSDTVAVVNSTRSRRVNSALLEVDPELFPPEYTFFNRPHHIMRAMTKEDLDTLAAELNTNDPSCPPDDSRSNNNNNNRFGLGSRWFHVSAEDQESLRALANVLDIKPEHYLNAEDFAWR